MQMPFELVGIDHPAHELNTDAYRKLNPFEQLPAIDDDGVVLTESAAILIYLAKKANKLIPSDPAGEAQVIRWSSAEMNSIELPLMSVLYIDWTAGCGLRTADCGLRSAAQARPSPGCSWRAGLDACLPDWSAG